MSTSRFSTSKAEGAPPAETTAPGFILQRKCACGSGAGGLTGECEDCRKRKLIGRQAKLEIGSTDDQYEKEADRVADTVMAGGLRAYASAGPLRVQRAADGDAATSAVLPADVGNALRSPGVGLDRASRSFFESRFDHDFSRVRIHHGAAADESARAIGAQAYTLGNHVVFASGRFAPDTHDGRRLMAHELAHVVQQSAATPVLRRKPAQASPATGSGDAMASLDRELDEDFRWIVIILDQYYYSDEDEEAVTRVLEKWAGRTIPGTRSSYVDQMFSRLTDKTKIIGTVVDQHTNYYSLIFNHFDNLQRIRAVRDNYSTHFRGDEGIAEVSVKQQLSPEELRKGTEEFWGKKFKEMGDALKNAGTPEAVQNLLGGVVGVIQGFAELAIELAEGIWTLAIAVKALNEAFLHVVMGAAQEMGLGFLQKVPLIGRLFDPATYKPGFDATVRFFAAAKGALQDPGRVWMGVKEAASKAWEEVMVDYARADEFNKSRIIARGVVKVGMAIGGAIKDLPKLAQSAGKMLAKVSQVAVRSAKLIAEGLKAGIRIGKQIFKGTWKVLSEALEDGTTRLRYFFQRTGAAAADEIPPAQARRWVHCSTCEVTPEGRALAEAAEKPKAGKFPDLDVEEEFRSQERWRREGMPEDVDEPLAAVPEDRPEGDLFNKTQREIDEAAQARERGNTFNTEREGAFKHNEVYVDAPAEDLAASGKPKRYRLDSYDPDKGIVSRKYPQGEALTTEKGVQYIEELMHKYPPGARIADTEGNRIAGIAGQVLKGRPILEVPVLLKDVPQELLEFADRVRVTIRDVTGKVYNLYP